MSQKVENQVFIFYKRKENESAMLLSPYISLELCLELSFEKVTNKILMSQVDYLKYKIDVFVFFCVNIK